MEFIVTSVGTDYKKAGDCVETVDNTYMAGASVSGKCALAAAKALLEDKEVVVVGGLATGSLVGIIVGALLLVAVIIGAVVFMMRRQSQQG